jgi:hypothetical protein
MKFEDLQEELWAIDGSYVRYLADTQHMEFVPVMGGLVLIAKILLYILGENRNK